MKKYKLDRIPMLENDTVLQPKDWQKRIQEEIHHIKQTHAKSTKKNDRYSSGILDMTTSMEKRRTVALLDSLKSVDVRYQKCADDWITLNLLSRSYASIEYDGHMLKAASIWILDKITEIYLPWKTLYPLLPHDDSLLDDFFDVDLWDAKWKRAACNIDPEYMRMLSPDTYSEETNHTQVDESGDWEDQKAKMEKQIQQLRSALHTAEKAAADARKQMEKQRLTAEAEHRELADLREIIFNNDDFDRVDDSTVEIADDKKYPYTIQKSTVVFGGHETWLKSLKPMLKGDIKFIAKEMKIDVSLVRYADVIWVQSNAIPHRSYYSIVNTARKLGKPIRYFTNASAVKCAEQIVENDKR